MNAGTSIIITIVTIYGGQTLVSATPTEPRQRRVAYVCCLLGRDVLYIQGEVTEAKAINNALQPNTDSTEKKAGVHEYEGGYIETNTRHRDSS